MRALFSITAAACSLLAQDSTASLSGAAIDLTGAGVRGIRTQLRSEILPARQYQTQTDPDGGFSFARLPAGHYSLLLLAPGFQLLTVKSIDVPPAAQIRLPPLELTLGTMGCGGPPPTESVRFLPAGGRTGGLASAVRKDYGPMEAHSPPIAGAEITLLCAGDKPCGTTNSDSKGRFVFSDLSPGAYTIRVNRSRYYPEIMRDLRVRPGLESTYTPVQMESCRSAQCDPLRRPKKPLALCE